MASFDFSSSQRILCSHNLVRDIFSFFSMVPDSSMPINLDYYVNKENNEIRIIRGSLLHEIHEYHDLVNPLIMKSKVKYKIEN